VILAAFSLALAACGGNSTPPSTFTISGTVVNLAGTGGLVLQDNLNDALPVNANGNFTFAKTVASGSPYSVTISAQPSNPTQTCGVTNAPEQQPPTSQTCRSTAPQRMDLAKAPTLRAARRL